MKEQTTELQNRLAKDNPGTVLAEPRKETLRIESAHTPGPWVVEDESNYSAPLVKGEGRPVAEVYGDGNEQRKANAHLIAGAPEMLAMLKEWPLNMSTEQWHQFHIDRLALVAKAEGRAS